MSVEKYVGRHRRKKVRPLDVMLIGAGVVTVLLLIALAVWYTTPPDKATKTPSMAGTPSHSVLLETVTPPVVKVTKIVPGVKETVTERVMPETATVTPPPVIKTVTESPGVPN